MSKDTVFDENASEAFLREIYSTTKGTVRLHVLWQDLLAEIRGLEAERLRVIDIGGGGGQLASKVAELGHEVTICDPSEEMLDKARASLEETGLGDTVHFCPR